jgi:hypothetical protein
LPPMKWEDIRSLDAGATPAPAFNRTVWLKPAGRQAVVD